MIAVALLVALVASAQVQAKPAKTAATIPSRDVFLTEVKDAVNSIKAAVALSHQKIQDAEEAGTEATETARIATDVDKFAARYLSDLKKSSDYYSKQGAEVASCNALFNNDLEDVLEEVTSAALSVLKRDLKDATDTPTKADGLLPQAAAVLQSAQEEVSKPDGQYGKEVPAILKAVQGLLSTATWNNQHIDAVLHALRWSTDTAISIWTNARSDLNASINYAQHCMSRHVPRN